VWTALDRPGGIAAGCGRWACGWGWAAHREADVCPVGLWAFTGNLEHIRRHVVLVRCDGPGIVLACGGASEYGRCREGRAEPHTVSRLRRRFIERRVAWLVDESRPGYARPGRGRRPRRSSIPYYSRNLVICPDQRRRAIRGSATVGWPATDPGGARPGASSDSVRIRTHASGTSSATFCTASMSSAGSRDCGRYLRYTKTEMPPVTSELNRQALRLHIAEERRL
jgi:hypothetical protein